MEDRPIRARRLSLVERLWRWSRRNPALAASSLVAATLAVLMVIGSVAAAWIYRQQRDAVTTAEKETAASRDQALAANRQSQTELGRTLVRKRRAMRLSGRVGQRATAIEALMKAVGIAREVGTPPRIGRSCATRSSPRWPSTTSSPSGPGRGWSRTPGGPPTPSKRIGSFSWERTGRSTSIACRIAPRSRRSGPTGPRPGTGRASLRAAGSSTSIRATRTSSYGTSSGARSPPPGRPMRRRCASRRRPAGGRRAGRRRAARLRPAGHDRSRRSLRLGHVTYKRADHGGDMALSGDGRRFAIEGETWRSSGSTTWRGHLVHELQIPAAKHLFGLALNHTGSLLAVTSNEAILTFNVTSGEVLARLKGPEDNPNPIYIWFQPGGGLLATSAWSGTTRLWDPIRGRPLAAFSGTFQGWQPDGSRLMIQSGPEITTYRLTAGFGRRTIDVLALDDQPGATVYGPTRSEYSPNGRLIALALRPDGVRLVRASDGKALACLPIGHCDEAVFLPDGGLVTNNHLGLCRWPIRRVSDGTLRVGPPEPLVGTGWSGRATALSPKG